MKAQIKVREHEQIIKIRQLVIIY